VFDLSSGSTPSAESKPFEPCLIHSVAWVSPGFARQIRPPPKLLKNSVPSADALMLSGKSVVPGTTTSAARAGPAAPSAATAQEPTMASGASARQNW